MHFALPPRKTSHPPPYASRSLRSTSLRRKRLQFGAIIACAALGLIFLLSRIFSSSWADRPPAGTPEVVLVTTIDDKAYSKDYVEKVKRNRQDYASRHETLVGYVAFFPLVTDYDLKRYPSSWSKVPAVRHAMTLYPHTTYFFFLDQHALIANPSLSITEHVMSPHRLESLMVKDQPVVPPDSIIKTFSHLKGENVDLVLTQDKDGLSHKSFIIRNGNWAKYFLDTWFDPLYRSYNFQKNEAHALEHIVQWHVTILAKLALVPQRTINSYSVDAADHDDNGLYRDGDFVVHFEGCDLGGKRDCEKELAPYYQALVKTQ
ncbi:MAG: hypothetical protein M1819_002209 [Sarea resinae]|nr:MAG: hypothetical protein M1819_002209 [Sarea resinae]